MILTHGANSIARGGGGGGGGAVIGDREYRVVTMPDGKVWLAENLDYKFQVDGNQIPIGVTGTPSTPAAWYYNNDEATYGVNGNKYGLLYNWYAVKYLEDNKSTLIPGWHVPTEGEWFNLDAAAGGGSVAGTVLKSATGWSSGAGTDDYGFGVVPAGYQHYGSFYKLGERSRFWTATENPPSSAYYRSFSTDGQVLSSDTDKTNAYSLRLVKD